MGKAEERLKTSSDRIFEEWSENEYISSDKIGDESTIYDNEISDTVRGLLIDYDFRKEETYRALQIATLACIKQKLEDISIEISNVANEIKKS